MRIPFKKTKRYRFLGRNGSGYCDGLDIFVGANPETLFISPITSKGKTARCEIQIPSAQLPEICAAMLGADLTSLVLDNLPPDSLPQLLGLNDRLDELIEKKLSATEPYQKRNLRCGVLPGGNESWSG